MSACDDMSCVSEQKPSKKERIAELTARVEAQRKDLVKQGERYREALETRDRALAVAGFLRVEDVIEIRTEADPFHTSFTASVQISKGTCQGLDQWRKQALR